VLNTTFIAPGKSGYAGPVLLTEFFGKCDTFGRHTSPTVYLPAGL
jgi:hypothetical protein